jgi:hypothetical protein
MVRASSTVASSARRLERSPFADGHDAGAPDAPHPAVIPATETAVATAARVRARVQMTAAKSMHSNLLFE